MLSFPQKKQTIESHYWITLAFEEVDQIEMWSLSFTQEAP